MTPERLVQVVKDQRARQNQYVNETVLDHIGEQAAHARRDQRAGRGHGNRGVVAQHVQPDAMSFGQLAAAKASAFHFFQQPSHRTIAVDLHRPRRNRQVFTGFWFSLCHHKLVLTSLRSMQISS